MVVLTFYMTKLWFRGHGRSKGRIWTQTCPYFPLYLQIQKHCPVSVCPCPSFLGGLHSSKGLTRVTPSASFLGRGERSLRGKEGKEEVDHGMKELPFLKGMNNLDWRLYRFRPTNHSAFLAISLSGSEGSFILWSQAKCWSNSSELCAFSLITTWTHNLLI